MIEFVTVAVVPASVAVAVRVHRNDCVSVTVLEPEFTSVQPAGPPTVVVRVLTVAINTMTSPVCTEAGMVTPTAVLFRLTPAAARNVTFAAESGATVSSRVAELVAPMLSVTVSVTV